LCDLEWRGPPGEVKSCGGNLIIRSEALQQVGMFNSTMVAGEEPELCIRLRRLTWKIVRLDQIMSVHDADMTSITQWWTRSSRAGRAFIELACLHREYGVRQALSTVIWGLLIPAGIVCLAFKYGSVGWLIGGGAYFIQVVRIFDSRLRLGDSKSEALLYSIFCLAQKIPQLHGMIIHLARSLRTPKSKLTLH